MKRRKSIEENGSILLQGTCCSSVKGNRSPMLTAKPWPVTEGLLFLSRNVRIFCALGLLILEAAADIRTQMTYHSAWLPFVFEQKLSFHLLSSNEPGL